MIRTLASATVLALLAFVAPISAKTFYQSTDGSTVEGPYVPDQPEPMHTALCGDGSRSRSHHRQGACSRHGGVTRWFGADGNDR